MAGNTPNNPTRRPSVPTGPSAGQKGSKSKVMSPMPKAGMTTPKGGQPASRSGVNPKASRSTVQGGPKK